MQTMGYEICGDSRAFLIFIGRRCKRARLASSKRKVITQREIVTSFFEFPDHLFVCSEDGIVLDLFVALNKDLRNKRFVTGSRDKKMYMSRAGTAAYWLRAIAHPPGRR